MNEQSLYPEIHRKSLYGSGKVFAVAPMLDWTGELKKRN
jgi:hypothetical protein